MPKQIDVAKIISRNAKINVEHLLESTEALKQLAQTGVVKPSTYSLETADSAKTLRYCGDAAQMRKGSILKLG